MFKNIKSEDVKKLKKLFKKKSEKTKNPDAIHENPNGVNYDISISEPPLPNIPNKALIYRSELQFLLESIMEYPNIETGGQLFGFWTAKGVPVVLYAIGPGPNAGHEGAFFSQDIDYLQIVGGQIFSKYGLNHIGEWHSHHQLGLAQPSGHDAKNMQSAINSNRLGRFLLCIGNCDSHAARIRPFNFVENSTVYKPSEWEIMECDSPFREKIDYGLREYLNLPKRLHNGEHEVNPNAVKGVNSIYREDYWLNEKENNIVLNGIKHLLEDENPGAIVKISFDTNEKIVHILVIYNGIAVEDISFPQNFPNCPPDYENKLYHISENEYNAITDQWYFNQDIYESFKSYYQYIRRYGLA